MVVAVLVTVAEYCVTVSVSKHTVDVPEVTVGGVEVVVTVVVGVTVLVVGVQLGLAVTLFAFLATGLSIGKPLLRRSAFVNFRPKTSSTPAVGFEAAV